MKRFLVSSLLLGLLAAALPLAPATAADPPVVVGTDPKDDWAFGVAGNPVPVPPLGNLLGQDLVEASIGMAEEPNVVNFIIKVTSLPPPGGMPEITRYIWDVTVDGNFLSIDGKYSNYSRGTCDPTAGTCPPPRDPGPAPFFIRGDCEQVENVTVCKELGKVQGKFDAASGTITIPIPLELLRAKPGSVIGPGLDSFAEQMGGSIMAGMSAWVTNATMGHDAMTMTSSFVVPGGAPPCKKKRCKPAAPPPASR